MMRRMRKFWVLVVAMSACANSSAMNRVQLGMTKAEVFRVVGEPVSSSARPGEPEVLDYQFTETAEASFYGIYTRYFVRLVNGRVTAYGRASENAVEPR